MTHPGDARIEMQVTVDGDSVPGEVRAIAEEIGAEGEPKFQAQGRDLGHALGEGVHKQLGKERRRLADDIENLIPARGRFKFEPFIDPSSGRVVRKRVFHFLEEIADDAFHEAGGPNSPFRPIGSAISDAIGSGFNVSGRSALIPFLIPLFGAIADLIGALITALQPLVGLLAEVPTLIAAIGIQVGVLIAAFSRVGPAIKNAFNAKNAKEFNEALKGLTEPAANFVRAIMPLKQLMTELRYLIELNFFNALGTNIKDLINVLSPLLKSGLVDVANALGTFFHNLIELLKGPVFQTFVANVFTSTTHWVQTFGPAFLVFLNGLFKVANRLMPLLDYFGEKLAKGFEKLGQMLSSWADDPDSKKFLESAKEVLDAVFRLTGALATGFVSIINSLASAGGVKMIDAITDSINMLVIFLASPVGQLALRGFIDGIVFLTYVFTFLVVGIIEVISVIGGLWDLLQFVALAIIQFFTWAIDQGIAFVDWVKGIPERIIMKLASFGGKIRETVKGWWDGLVEWAKTKGAQIALGFVDALTGGLFGLQTQYATQQALQSSTKAAVEGIAKFFPHSPAEKGPFSGEGSPAKRGEATIRGFAEGMLSESRSLNNTYNQTMAGVSFGPGAVQVNYTGVPTETQARHSGMNIGGGIASSIATINAIRTL